jgi:peptidoglycan lytic transglycosylase
MKQPACFAAAFAAALLVSDVAPHAQQSAAPDGSADAVLKPTSHPRLPAEASQLWMAPDAAARAAARSPAVADFTQAVRLEVDNNFARALPILMQPSVRQGTLGHYAEYYQGLAELRLGRQADARRTFQALQQKQPLGYLIEAAALREADADEALGDPGAALQIYDRLAKEKTTTPDEVLMRLGRLAKAAGNPDKATEAFSRIVYEFPFSDLAPVASDELTNLPIGPIAAGTNRYKLEVGRAERLFGAKRYAPAKAAFETLRPAAQGDDRELVNLRIAECDYFLKRVRNARDGVRPYIEKASRQGEALFFYAIATRDLGDHDEYLRTIRRIVDEFPTQSWPEEALNNLATYYILQNDDDKADETFRELYEKFPTGHYAERAAWKIGWTAYKGERYGDAIRAFESGAARFPRSDYRPAWLYWAGRAHDALREPALADARYVLVATDYLNSYYGRLAVKRLDVRGTSRLAADIVEPAPEVPPLPPNEPIVRALLALDLYDQALDELRYAQKNWGDSSAIQATMGWVYNRRGDLRAGINAMKRAYPQYLAAGGEKLPAELLKVLFPVDYWPQIRRYASEHQLDPYMIAALIAQESTFTADVKSAANAYGLMQLLPSTGRQYARKVGISKRFSIGLLTTADTNLRMGTAYFADLVQQFGGAHFALATYNAGPNRVQRWIAEKAGMERDEFIDDIPFPETQNYVKKILGTAEDYRRLYGADGPADEAVSDAKPAVSHDSTPASAKKASAAKTPAKKTPPPAAKKKSSTTHHTKKAA